MSAYERMQRSIKRSKRLQVRTLALSSSSPDRSSTHDKIVALAARHALPTMYHFREFAEAGGLISYGIDSRVTYRQIGFTLEASSRAKSQLICRYGNRPNSNWSST
jgi:hypothetical protein